MSDENELVLATYDKNELIQTWNDNNMKIDEAG